LEKQNNIFWNLTFIFFIFFSIFIIFKFIFIFFFRAAFEPDFIFELTPFFLFLGVNNLQLLFLSLAVVLSDTYFHMRPTRKNILYSFIPTLMMVSGLGVGITTKDISADYLPSYLLFGFLLFVVIIDQRRTLMHPETLATATPTKIEPTQASQSAPAPQPAKARFALPKVKFSVRGRPKPVGVPTAQTTPEGVPISQTTTEGTPIVKPKPHVAIANSITSLFKRKKRTSEPEVKKEVKEMPKPISFESAEKEEQATVAQAEGETPAPTEKFTPVEPSVEEEPSEEFKPVPLSEVKEKLDSEVHIGGTPSGGTGGVPLFVGKENVDAFKSDAYKFSPVTAYKSDEMGVGKELKLPEEAKDTSKVSEDNKVSYIEKQVEGMDKKSLGEIEQMFSKDKGRFDDKKYLEKQQFGVTAEPPKQIISNDDWKLLREKIANRSNEIKSDSNIIQDVKSDFKKIEGGLDSLKDKLVNIGDEIQSTVQEVVISGKKPEERSYHDRYDEEREPHRYPEESRRRIEEEIVEDVIDQREWLSEDNYPEDINEAQVILDKLEKRVKKLEQIYLY
jgi:hypothetical protein